MKNIWAKYRVRLFIVFLVTLVSCTSQVAEYPSDWPNLVQVAPGKCTDLTGVYAMDGLAAMHNKRSYDSHNLYQYFGKKRGYKRHNRSVKHLKQIKIKHVGNGNFDISVWGSKKSQSQILVKTLSKVISIANEDYQCIDGFMVLPDSTYSGYHDMGTYKTRHKIYITRAKDKSIISKEINVRSNTFFLIIIPIPTGRSSVTNWYRFYPFNKRKILESLENAIKKGELGTIRALVNSGTDVDTKVDGWPLIVIAANYNRRNITHFLLRRRANVDARNINGDTALILAAHNDYANIARVLLPNGAKVNIAGFDGATALMWAAKRGHASVVRILLEYNANIEMRLVPSKYRKTYMSDAYSNDNAISLATQAGHSKIVKMLLRHQKKLKGINNKK